MSACSRKLAVVKAPVTVAVCRSVSTLAVNLRDNILFCLFGLPVTNVRFSTLH